MLSKNKVINLVLINIIFSIIFIFIYTSQLKPNQVFVSYSLLVIFYIFGLVAVFLHKSKVIRYTALSIIFMSAFGFILVPLYDVFCDVTGLNGKLDLNIAVGDNQSIDLTRIITIEFVVNKNKEMPWEFKPQLTSIKVHPGQLTRTAYYAKNTTKQTMTAQAIPSIAPSKASKYFKKTECFCFNSQKLGPGESTNLGLQFYLDKDLPKDVQRLTLAYTLFDITDITN